MRRNRKTYPTKRVTVTEACDCGSRSRAACWHCKGTGLTKRTEQMFVCVGGPFAGEWKNASTLRGYNYTQFNNGWRGDPKLPRAVWLHESCVPEVVS